MNTIKASLSSTNDSPIKSPGRKTGEKDAELNSLQLANERITSKPDESVGILRYPYGTEDVKKNMDSSMSKNKSQTTMTRTPFESNYLTSLKKSKFTSRKSLNEIEGGGTSEINGSKSRIMPIIVVSKKLEMSNQ